MKKWNLIPDEETSSLLFVVILVFITYLNLSFILIKHYAAPSLTKPLMLAGMILVAIRWFSKNRPALSKWSPLWMMALMALVWLIAAIGARDTALAFDRWLELVKNLIICAALFLLMVNRDSVRPAIWAITAAGFFTGTLGAYKCVSGNFGSSFWGFARAEKAHIISDITDYRLTGIINDDPNYYAQYLLIILALSIILALTERKTTLRIAASWTALVTLICLVNTHSRGGIIGLGGVLICLLIIRTPRWKTLALILPMFLVAALLAPPQFFQRQTTVSKTITQSKTLIEYRHYKPPENPKEKPKKLWGPLRSFQRRLSENVAAFLVFLDYPVFGVGPGNFPLYYQEYAEPLGWDNRPRRTAHNLFLHILAETGIFGFGVFILFISYIMKELVMRFRAGKRSEIGIDAGGALLAALVGYFTAGLFLSFLLTRFFWVLIGICLAWICRANGSDQGQLLNDNAKISEL